MGKPNSESLESLLRRCRIGIATLRLSGPDSPTQKIHREDRRSVSRGWEKGFLASFYFLTIWPRRQACSKASAGSRPVTCLYHAGWQDASGLYGLRVQLHSRGVLRGLEDILIHQKRRPYEKGTRRSHGRRTVLRSARSLGTRATVTPSCKIICWEFSSGAARQSSDSGAGRSRFPGGAKDLAPSSVRPPRSTPAPV